METNATSNSVKPARLLSLDALRGFDMFWIMSGEGVIHALAKATGWPLFLWMSGQLHHTNWNGITFYDMIFPLFLFIAGVSMPYSMSNKIGKYGVAYPDLLPANAKKEIYRSMIRRTLILIFLGMVVNGLFKFNGYENTRFASVLGRIGLAWFFAGLIYLNFGLRGQVWWLGILLLGYWAAMELIPVPGYGAGVLTMNGSLESYIDRLLLPGRLHDKVHDPEGILSTIPAIGTAMLGIFTGQFLKYESAKWPMWKKGLGLFIAGLVLISLGLLWNMAFPINKRLWTSSFVLFVGGWSLIFLSVFYLVIDVAGYRKWAFPFVLIGVNSIVIYLAAEGMVDFQHTANFLFGGLIAHLAQNWQTFWGAVSIVIVQLTFLYILYRNKIFLKI
ncbi:acyltransferase family protein [Mucilaginibacter sp. RCC_168]|uniref:acyltransferase family protein n=1 Tax=Mucilaginibacter sp. RCC_168 TaxID=3239221 RepID=UPI003524A855